MRERLSYWRSVLWFAPLVGLATLLCGTVSLLFSLLERWLDPRARRRHQIARMWARQLVQIGRIRVEVEGLEHLPDSACVMVCNHLSYMDVPVLFAALPLQFRILARKSLFSIPLLGGHLQRCGHLAVDHANPRASLRSLVQAAETVAGGLPLFVFPEGGRSLSGVMRPFISGAFFVAVQAQAPIVPMVLVGTREVLTPRSLHLRPGTVRLIVCPPIPTAGLTRKDVDALAQRVRAEMLALYDARHAPAEAEAMPSDPGRRPAPVA